MAKSKPQPESESTGTKGEIVWLNIDDLKLDPKNVNKHDDRSVESIAASLLEFGWQASVLVNEDTKTVRKGNGTIMAARRLRDRGHQQFAKAKCEYTLLRGDAETAFAIADNKIGRLSEFDYPELAEQLKALQDSSPTLLAATGFADFELAPLLSGDWSPPAVEEDEPETDAAEVEDEGPKQVVYKATPGQAERIDAAILKSRDLANSPDMPSGQALEAIARWYLEQHAEQKKDDPTEKSSGRRTKKNKP